MVRLTVQNQLFLAFSVVNTRLFPHPRDHRAVTTPNQKIFEANSSFDVKQRTTGKV